jgi:hypothetical protein
MIRSKRMIQERHVLVEMKNAYRILIESPEGKRPIVTPRSTWEDNIKTDLTEVV